MIVSDYMWNKDGNFPKTNGHSYIIIDEMLIKISKRTTSCAVKLHVTRCSTFSNMHNTKLAWTEACSVGCMHALMHSHMHVLMYRQKGVNIFSVISGHIFLG